MCRRFQLPFGVVPPEPQYNNLCRVNRVGEIRVVFADDMGCILNLNIHIHTYYL